MLDSHLRIIGFSSSLTQGLTDETRLLLNFVDSHTCYFLSGDDYLEHSLSLHNFVSFHNVKLTIDYRYPSPAYQNIVAASCLPCL